MKKQARRPTPLVLNKEMLRAIEKRALACAQGGTGQVYPGTEYDLVLRPETARS